MHRDLLGSTVLNVLFGLSRIHFSTSNDLLAIPVVLNWCGPTAFVSGILVEM